MVYFIAAYGIIWLGTIAYCISLAMTLNRVTRDLKSLQKKLKK